MTKQQPVYLESFHIVLGSDNVWTDKQSESDSEADLESGGSASGDRQYTRSLRDVVA